MAASFWARFQKRFDGFVLAIAYRRLHRIPFTDFVSRRLPIFDRLLMNYLTAAYFEELGKIDYLYERTSELLKYAMRLRKLTAREIILMELQERGLFEETDTMSPTEIIASISKNLGIRVPSNASVMEIIGYLLYLRRNVHRPGTDTEV